MQPDGDDLAYLTELRLQNLDRLDLDRLIDLGKQNGSPKLRRAVQHITALAQAESMEYETL